MGRVFPYPVGTQLRRWLPVPYMAAATTSAYKSVLCQMCHFPAIYLQCAIPEIDAALLAAKDVRPWAVQRSLLQDLSFPKWFPETHPQTLPPSERFIDWCFCGQSVRRGSSLTPPLPCTEERRFHSRVKRFHGNMAAHQLIYWNKCLKKHFHRTRDACILAQQIGQFLSLKNTISRPNWFFDCLL